MHLVQKTLDIAINYNKKFEEHKYLWQCDRAQVLSHFLKYCKIFYSKSVDFSEMQEKTPTLENYKDQVENLTILHYYYHCNPNQ